MELNIWLSCQVCVSVPLRKWLGYAVLASLLLAASFQSILATVLGFESREDCGRIDPLGCQRYSIAHTSCLPWFSHFYLSYQVGFYWTYLFHLHLKTAGLGWWKDCTYHGVTFLWSNFFYLEWLPGSTGPVGSNVISFVEVTFVTGFKGTTEAMVVIHFELDCMHFWINPGLGSTSIGILNFHIY